MCVPSEIMTAIDTGERSEQESERCSEGPGIFVRGMRGWVTIRKHPLKLRSYKVRMQLA